MMKIQALVVTSLLAIFAPFHAFANSVESATTLGSGTLNQAFTYNISASNKEEVTVDQAGKTKKDSKSPVKPVEKNYWSGSVGYSYTATTLGATSGTTSGSAAIDHTNSVNGGVAYSNRWEAGADFEYSSTKEENLHNFGANPYVGYTFDLHEGEDFTSTLNLRFTAGFDSYTQTGNTVTRRAGSRRPVTVVVGSANIQQTKAEFDALLSPASWLDLKLIFIKYQYDKDVNAFLARLDDPRAIITGAANFGSTLNGFSSNEGTAALTFHLPADIDFTTQFTQATSVVNSSKLNTYALDAMKLWHDTWKTGVGFSRSKSSTDLQSLTTLTLSYQW